MVKIFIDGSAGTTGLRIADRLRQRRELQLIHIPEDLRKNPEARREAFFSADIIFLCLPDTAAVEAVALAEGSSARIIDTSTAHRTASGWVYGFPELKGQREKIRGSSRIANPGCHASGFIALTAPLVQEGFLPKASALRCFSLTGYSGGGKKMIAEYEAADRSPLLKGPRQYGLSQEHKHLKEMQLLCGLDRPPVFSPIVCDFYCGMELSIPLFADEVKADLREIRELYESYYQSGFVRFSDHADPDGMLSAAAFAGRDDMEITVQGNEERILLTARFDNLGKGASGAAIQNMNLLLGLEEDTGLCV